MLPYTAWPAAFGVLRHETKPRKTNATQIDRLTITSSFESCKFRTGFYTNCLETPAGCPELEKSSPHCQNERGLAQLGENNRVKPVRNTYSGHTANTPQEV